MGHSRSRSRGRQGSPSRVGEEVQYSDRSVRIRAGSGDEGGEPFPVHGLFRKKPRMLKAEGLQAEGQAVPGAPDPGGILPPGGSPKGIGNAPLVGEPEELPLPAALALRW